MTDNSILEVLAQLESDLKDIKSAKEQIDSVLKADGKITESLAKYSLQLGAITTQLGSLKSFISSEVKGIVSDVEADIKEDLTSVGEHVARITKLSSELEDNVKQVTSNTTEDLNESCNKIIQNFEVSTNRTCEQLSKQASDSIDKLIHAAKELKDSSKDFSDSKKEVFQKIDALASDLVELKGQINRAEKTLSSLVNESTKHTMELQYANKGINQILTNFKTYNTSLQSALKSIEEENNKNKYELKEAINTNKNILFVIVFLVVVDIILRFIS